MSIHRKSIRPTIGVLAGWQVFTGTPDSFLGHVYRGIYTAARERDCNLLLGCGINYAKPAWPILSPDNAFIPVGHWNTDGLIIVSPLASEAGSRYTQELIASGFPIVFAGDRDEGPAVVPDNESGIRQIIAHLVEHGHSEIAFVAGRYNAEHGDTGIRLRAFEAELRANNLPFNPQRIAFGQHTYDGGRQAVRQMLESGQKFSAVVASNDRSAIGVIDELQQLGYSIPQDIAVIGFDDRLEARAQVPSLTTVHYPMFGLGYQAVDLLLRSIHGQSVKDELVRIPTRLVIRESCGCLPGIAAAVKKNQAQGSVLLPGSRQQVITHLAERMTVAVHNESFWLNQQEVAYLCQRLAEAFLASVEQKDPQSMHLMVKQILDRVSSRGDDLFAWQSAVTILRDNLPLIRQAVPGMAESAQTEDMLHHLRVAISETARGRSTGMLISQASESDQVSLMTSKLFTAHEEREIYETLSRDLPEIGIQSTTVGYYEAGGEDPVAWGVLQTSRAASEGTPGVAPGTRFPIRAFPPKSLYPAGQAFQLALLPLTILEEVCGFVAFDAGNLNPCADIVRQLGAALRGVRLYREAVEARHLAEEGRRMAEEANRLKSRFLSIVSHELRTPLNLISGLSRILLDEYEAGDQKQPAAETSFQEDLQRIFISSQHLDGLIRDVLDLASSDIGQLKLVCESLDLYEVLQAASVIGEQLARDKGIKWHVEFARDLPRVWGDRTRLRQVTLNLINNALKFTARGEISLTALVKNEHVVVSVSDTGLGIPLHEQEVIFDEFRQSDRTATRGYGGLGLGLAICKKLVEMHGGEIGVCSSGKEGEGSNFFFSLPVVDMEDAAQGDFSSLTEQRILLLVKDRQGGEMIRGDLLRRGHNVQLCVMETENDWLAVILRAAPDVVVLDLGLTSQRGWDILKVMKENPATKNTPVLFFSLNGEAGAGSLLEVDYLTKPLTTNAVSEILAARGLFNPDGSQDTQTILIVDDEPAILHLYTRILDEELPGHRILQAGNGLEALQILRQESPALVLLDLMMPEMDGFCVLEEMRKSETLRNIPVVVVTGQALTREDLDRLNTGVVSVLGKGIFREEEILQHISKALERKRKPGSETQYIARKAMAYIHSNYADPISRSDVAAYVGLSERHLARCFQQEVGISPITYLNRYRVRQAKSLLDAGKKGITEIAVEVGFSSSSYFTRVFRDEVGVSPRTYLRGQCKELEMSDKCKSSSEKWKIKNP